RPARLPVPGAGSAIAAWAVAAVLATAALFAFVPGRLRELGPLAVSLALAGAIVLLVLLAERTRLPAWAGPAVDAALVAAVVLAAIDASAFLPQLPFDPVSGHTAHPSLGDNGIGAQLLHHGFYLGPVNDVLHGRAVLVDTYSQYGVGVIYFLAGVFAVLPLGYGPMALVSGALTGLACAAGYATLRLAGCGRALAAIALAAGIATTQLNTIGSVADFPSTGALRYGPAYLLILLVGARARWPGRERPWRMAELGVVAISAVWSAEALVYALAIVAAAEGIEALMAAGPARSRVKRWLIEVARAVGVAAAAIGLLVVLTRPLAGAWPDFGPYFALLSRYSSRDVPEVLVFPPISAWSTGFAVGFLYLASAVVAVRAAPLARTRPELRRSLVAIAALTAFGIVSLSYWVTHGYPFTLRWIALPAVLVGALWVDRAARLRAPRLRLAGLGAGAAIVALLVVFGWPQVHRTADRTALVHLLPGAPSFRHDVGSLWHSPRIDPRSLDGETLLRRYAPGQRPVAMLTGADLGLEILMRSDRANALPLGHPLQSALIRREILPQVRRAIARLAPGTVALTEVPGSAPAAASENRLLAETIALLRRRFVGRVVARSSTGLVVVRLQPRR
nr:hypothetical protein [Actinomycetota bacterium]